MSKKKIILIVLAVVAGLFVALFVLASVLITPERVREAILPLAEDALERKVELGAIDVSLFSGISLQDIKVERRDGKGEFVSAEKVVLRYNLLALLRLKVEIGEMNLVQPQIVIIRNKDGSFNFSDLAGKDDGDLSNSESADSSDDAGDSPAIDLLVSKVGITNGRLLFIDNAGAGQPVRHEIKSFNLKAKNVSTTSRFPLEVSADWNGNALSLVGEIDLPRTAAEVEASFNSIEVQLAGSMQDDKIKATLKMPKTDFSAILSSVPKEYMGDFDGAGVTGHLSLNVNLEEDVLKTSGFVVNANGQEVKLDLSVSNLYAAPINVKFRVDSPSIDLDRLIPETAGEEDKTVSSDENSQKEELGPFDIPVKLNGEARVGKAISQGVPLTDLLLKVSLEKNVLTIQNLSTVIAGGTFRETGKVDLGVKGLKYSTEIELKGVGGGEIIKILKPDLADSVKGVLGGEMKFSGAGTRPVSIKKKLTGQGTIRLADGKLQNIPALNSVAALLDLGELRDVDLDDGHVNFSIKNGQVTLNSEISGSTTRFTTTGQAGLNGGLNLRSKLAVSPELGGRLHAKGKLARYLGDENGWTTVPLRVKGSYDNPDVGLDSKGLKKQAEKKAKQEVQRKIEKELNKRLKGLFGN